MKQPPHPSLQAVDLAQVLAALADPIRLEIVAALADGTAKTCGEFDLPVAKSTVSHHMKVLREAGVLRSEVDGTRCLVSLRLELERRFPGLLRQVLSLKPGFPTTRS